MLARISSACGLRCIAVDDVLPLAQGESAWRDVVVHHRHETKHASSPGPDRDISDNGAAHDRIAHPKREANSSCPAAHMRRGKGTGGKKPPPAGSPARSSSEAGGAGGFRRQCRRRAAA